MWLIHCLQRAFTDADFYQQGNPELKEQVGTTWSAGVQWQPGAVSGLSMAVNYSHIEINDFITNVVGFFQTTESQIAYGNDVIPGSVVETDSGSASSNRQVDVNNKSANIARRVSESIDFDISHQVDNQWGSFLSQIRATHTLANQFETEQVIDSAGTIDGPSDWVVRAALHWERQHWSANAVLNYEDSYQNTDSQALSGDVDAYHTVDLRVAYSLPTSFGGGELALGSTNLFNQDYPFVDNAFGFDSTRVNFRKRAVYLELKAVF